MRTDLRSQFADVALCFATVVGMAFVPGTAYAQTATQPTAFDSASIRRNVNNVGKCLPDQLQATASGLRMTNCPLVLVLGTAYTPTNGESLGFAVALGDRIVGMPDWMKSERYDISAHFSDADAEAWKDPVRQRQMFQTMLQTLLAERCKLIVHRAMRDRPIYAIVVGKNGPKLKPAETHNLDELHAKYPNGMALPAGGGVVSEEKGGGAFLHGATMGTLALGLTYNAGRPVVDKTGLTGRYEIDLPQMQSVSENAPNNDGRPTVFDVVEGLGLKLESQKEPVEVLVIDHAERPSEN